MSQACINVYVDRYDYTNHMASAIIQAFTKGLLRAVTDSTKRNSRAAIIKNWHQHELGCSAVDSLMRMTNPQ